MNRKRFSVVAILALVLACSSGEKKPGDNGARTAPLLEGMGKLDHPITVNDPMAQRFFNQGLVLSYGFNHAEADRSFREAARIDPKCGMCWWGAALVLGPNINAAMEDDNVPRAWEALQRARELSGSLSEKERAYIDALSTRYAENPGDDRTSLDEDYASAMRDLARRYPDDADAWALLAEALMDLHPWDYWSRGGEPREWTPEILAAIDKALEVDPEHPGAHHFHIHAVEASPDPGRATHSADVLGQLVPGAGHLVHMPSHIYIHIGRYHDATLANQKAIAADDSYVTQCHAQGIYPLAYMPHNRHFLWAAATLEGRGELAIDAALQMADRIDQEQMREEAYSTLQHFWITPVYALVRFGKWEDILGWPEPDADLVYPVAIHSYARGLAQTSRGRLDEASRELERVREIAGDPAIENLTIWDMNKVSDLVKIAEHVLAGEIAAKRGEIREAVRHLRRAMEIEDGLRYDEPPTWHHPVRQVLGAILIEAGRPAEAERVYREDLRVFPNNGWSLRGLEQSLRDQGRTAEAGRVRSEFEKAWALADVVLETSRL